MPPTAGPPAAAGLRERIAALNPRERRFIAVGAAALLIFLLYLLWPSPDDSDVELAETPPPAMQPAFSPPPPPIAAPAPVPAMPAAPPPPMANASAAAGVILRGVMGGGPSGGAAIFAFPDGAQRLVRVGREMLPGMILREIGVRHAIASSGGGDIRLELNKAGGVALTAAPSAPAAPVSPASPAAAPASAQRETTQFRLGLQPIRRDGRLSGYAIRPGAALPRLQAAGLRPGDVIVGVNGSELDEERLLELSWQLSNSGTAEFEFIRNGRRMKASLGQGK